MGRYEVHLEGQVRQIATVDGVPCASTACAILDISAGGLRFESAQSFEQDQLLCLAVSLPDGTDEPFELLADTRWVGTMEDAGLQRVSVQFRELPEAASDQLQRYLDTLDPNG